MALIVTDALKFRESENDQFRRLSLSANFNTPVPVSQGGTGANNAADAITNLGFESGNGYLKLPDGTLICWGILTGLSPRNSTGSTTGQIYYYEYPVNVTFPVAFTDIPALSVTPFGGVMCASAWVVCNRTSFTEVDVISGTNKLTSDRKLRVSWVAVGRWK